MLDFSWRGVRLAAGLSGSLALHLVLFGLLLASSIAGTTSVQPPDVVIVVHSPKVPGDLFQPPGAPAGEPGPPPPISKGDPDGGNDAAPPAAAAPAPSPQEGETPAGPEEGVPAGEQPEGPAPDFPAGPGGPGRGPFGHPDGDVAGSPYGELGGEGGPGSGVPGGLGEGSAGPPESGEVLDGRLHPPRRVSGEDPAYPALAARSGVEGTVLIRLVVGADGEVREAVVIRSVPLLDRAALEAVKRWRYEPARVAGRAVAVYLLVEFSFVMR